MFTMQGPTASKAQISKIIDHLVTPMLQDDFLYRENSHEICECVSKI